MPNQTSLIWCQDNLIVTGCADGRLEFWEGITGNFKGIYKTEHTRIKGGTNIKLTGNKVVAARLGDRIDFLRLETYTQCWQIDWGFTSAYRRSHIRTGSAGSLSMFQQLNGPASVHHALEEELHCILEFHQQGTGGPAGDVSGSGRRNRLDRQQFTLHDHSGQISCPQLDVTSAEDYRKLREYEQEKFLSMVKQVKDAGATGGRSRGRFIDRYNRGGCYQNHDCVGGGGHPDKQQELFPQDQLPPKKFPGSGGCTLPVGKPGDDHFNDDVPQHHYHQWSSGGPRVFVITVSRRMTLARAPGQRGRM
ncbi:sterol regulatory element binding protein cleavage-activating protein [Culex quinquefasciatus]|uniref:Sterol regulatory element binding protein cleavage-activating protein n=1 Tax=Culex quinquefasciatus TaxID=7176 RepID=B0XD17_CULQU|nr:sterol regulatory element binding protein cleavage-activating protein [Culex quinquefasciatus]|eukprot:XP_001867539.1 sterol regulatory element binding protein cleavage-activating protein [Culex quinquefasciatus]